MFKRILSTLACLALATAIPAASSEGETHGHKAPHGGMVKTAGKYHVEMVRTEAGLDIYLLDEKEGTLPIEGVTGSVTCLTKDKKKLELKLQPGDGHFSAATDPKALEGGTLVVALRRGEESISAKFTMEGHAEHEKHAEHPHH